MTESVPHHALDVLGSMEEAIMYLDKEMRICWANRAAIADLKNPTRQLYGQYCHEIRNGSCTIHQDCPVALAMKTGKQQEGFLSYSDDRILRIRGYPIRSSAGEIIGAVEVTIDVTEPKKNEVALREREELYRTLVETCPDGITLTDLEGNLIAVNTKVAKIYGYEDTQDLMSSGKTAFDHIVPEDKTRAIENARKTLEQGGIRNVEYLICRKDGTKLPVELNASLLRDASGNPKGFVSVARDISERKRTEEDNRQLQGQILHAQKLESMGVMAGGIAHDFNNFLMGIMGNISLISNLNKDPKLGPYIEKAQAISKQASSLTQQLLAFAGHDEIKIEAVDVNKTILEMIDLLELSIGKQATLRLNCSKDLPLIEGNQSQLQQVIMNLVINASESFGNNTGEIDLVTGVRVVDKKTLHQCVLSEGLKAGDYVLIEVSDTGCGISKEDVSKIFDPFFSSKFVGRGLGLAAVIGVVKSNGGTIWMKSQVGRGTTIQVLFPVQEQYSSSPQEQISRDLEQGLNGTVLIIEDESHVLDVTENMLRTVGFEVYTAPNGIEGIQKYKENPDEIDYVLLDVFMPTLSGAATMQAILSIRPAQKVVLMSGYAKDKALSNLDQSPNIKFIQKPFQMNELLAVFSED